jgi:multiple sugar transport system permease protein
MASHRITRSGLFSTYLLLAVGSAIFCLPFVWMVATSFKVDRELMTERLHIFPQAPHAALTSPSVDLREFRDLDGPRYAEALAILSARAEELVKAGVIAAADPALDTQLRLPDAIAAASRGIYRKLLRTVPNVYWDSPDLVARLQAEVHRDALAKGLQPALREFGVGSLRIRAKDDNEMLLPALGPDAREWKITGTGGDGARMIPCSAPDFPGRTLAYSLKGERLSLSQTVVTPFAPAEFAGVTLSVLPDDSWHRLIFYVRRGNEWLRAVRPFYLGYTSTAATDVTWQIPSAADQSNQVKSWILLEPCDPPAWHQAGAAAEGVELILSIERSSTLGAWWGKLSRNYHLTFTSLPFWRYFATSLFVVILNIVFSVVSCSLVAFAFSRLTWPGRDTLFAVLLSTMMIPAQVTMIPQFMIFKAMGWYNTLTPLWIGAIFANAFYVFLLRQFMKSIPTDLEDAARIDGCSLFGIYRHIILPLIKPALATIAIFTFLATWNDFMTPLIYLNDERLYTLSLGMFSFRVQVGAGEQAVLMAACTLMLLPVVLIFLFAQRYFIQGVTLTGIK